MIYTYRAQMCINTFFKKDIYYKHKIILQFTLINLNTSIYIVEYVAIYTL